MKKELAAAPTPPAPCHEEFERRVKEQTPTAELTRADDGEYIVPVIQSMWTGYCMATPPAPEVEPGCKVIGFLWRKKHLKKAWQFSYDLDDLDDPDFIEQYEARKVYERESCLITANDDGLRNAALEAIAEMGKAIDGKDCCLDEACISLRAALDNPE